MERLTPTGLAKTGGRRVTLLGSLRAVLERLPDEEHAALLVVSDERGEDEARRLWRELGRTSRLWVYAATRGPDELYTFRPETIIGVAPDAYHGILGRMWAAVQRAIETRYQTVHWG
jgi:hypothetical protein